MSRNAKDVGYALSPARPVPGTGARVEFLRGSSRPLHRARLHRLRNLFLLLPRARRDYCLPHKSKGKAFAAAQGGEHAATL